MGKIIYITESQSRLLMESPIDGARIQTVHERLDSYHFAKAEMKGSDGTTKTIIVPSDETGAFLQNKKGAIPKSYDEIFFLLQKEFQNKLTSDLKYRDAIIKYVIANWAFPERYTLWKGPDFNDYVDEAGQPMFRLA